MHFLETVYAPISNEPLYDECTQRAFRNETCCNSLVNVHDIPKAVTFLLNQLNI